MTFPAVQPPSAPKKHPKWPWVVAAVAAFVIVGSIASATEPTPAITAEGTAAVTTSASVPTTDPAVAAAESAAAKASWEAAESRYSEAAQESSEAAEQSSKAAVSSSAAAEAERKAEEEAERKANQVTYSVTTTGAGISSVTYSKPDFNISQETNVRGKKWARTIEIAGDTLGIGLNAQNAGGGTITCRVTRGDGSVLSENSSSGEYAVVSCG